MSTFLQLVNQAREECDAGGVDLSSLSGVAGESLRFKNWVIRSWEEIQERYRWKWMRAAFSFTTTANDGSYTAAQAGISSRFGMWDKTFCTAYLTSAGTSDQTELKWLDYETFRQVYLTGAQTDNRPLHFTSGDSNELLVGPKPDSTLYTVAGHYYKSPQTLSADSDEPELPEQHRIIVARAMKKYARFTSAPEIFSEAAGEERRILMQLTGKYLPAMQTGDPLV